MVGTCDTRDDDLEMPYHVDPQKLRTLQNFFRSTGPHASVREIFFFYVMLLRTYVEIVEELGWGKQQYARRGKGSSYIYLVFWIIDHVC